MPVRSSVILILSCSIMGCVRGHVPRGAAGMQTAPDDGYLTEPMVRPIKGRSGAPAPSYQPAQGKMAPPEPIHHPTQMWGVLDFSSTVEETSSNDRASTEETSSSTQWSWQHEDIVGPTYGPKLQPRQGLAQASYPIDSWTRDEVRAGMEGVRRRLATCFDDGLPSEGLEVTVVLMPNGMIEHVALPESLSEHEVICAENQLMQANFRQIHGSPLRVIYPYTFPTL